MGTVIEVLTLCLFGIAALGSALIAVIHASEKPEAGKQEQLRMDFETDQRQPKHTDEKSLAGHH